MGEEKKYTESLFSDTGPVDKKKVFEAIKDLVIIHKQDLRVYFQKQAKDFKIEDKILIYALAKKLMMLENFSESEEISAKEIVRISGMPGGSVYPTFKKLKESDFLVGSVSSYIIPNHKVDEVIEQLKQKNKSK